MITILILLNIDWVYFIQVNLGVFLIETLFTYLFVHSQNDILAHKNEYHKI